MMKLLRHLTLAVSRLEPGQRIVFGRSTIQCARKTVRPAGIDGPPWSVPDEIMELIVGSSYQFVYRVISETGDVEFKRLREPMNGIDGRRSYVAPDLREHFEQQADGIFVLRQVHAPVQPRAGPAKKTPSKRRAHTMAQYDKGASKTR